MYISSPARLPLKIEDIRPLSSEAPPTPSLTYPPIPRPSPTPSLSTSLSLCTCRQQQRGGFKKYTDNIVWVKTTLSIYLEK